MKHIKQFEKYNEGLFSKSNWEESIKAANKRKKKKCKLCGDEIKGRHKICDSCDAIEQQIPPC